MSREWQPGDLAMVTYRLGQCTERNLCAKTDKGWDCLAPGVGFLMHGDVIDALAVAVIPYEDRAQVERPFNLIDAAEDATIDTVPNADEWALNAVQVALREFANPPDPTPEEPTDPAVRVRDKQGDDWARVRRGTVLYWVNAFGGKPHTWDSLVEKFGPVEVVQP